MDVINDICSQAKEFIQALFKIYLEDRDFERLISMFHEDISWFGTGEGEVCHNYGDALRLLKEEKNAWDGYFKIIDQNYEFVPIDADCCLVYGEIKMAEDGLKTFLLDMDSRFSMICKRTENGIKLYHAHFSVPNQAQKEGEFVHKSLVEDYNLKLEETLQERTTMLKEKMNELESLTNNICGGVKVCKMDENATISFLSKGFFELTGYSQEEIIDLFDGLYIPFVYEPDRIIVKNTLHDLIENKGIYSIEYRLVHKDNRIIWVLDKGNLIIENHDEVNVQSILTDITARKEQEEELKISKKRYEIAMNVTEVTMFEYNVLTKDLIFFDDVSSMYNVENVVKNGPQQLIDQGSILPQSVPAYLEMYRKIHEGAPTASCFLCTKDKCGTINDYELTLTNIFNDDGKPIRSIGVRKNIEQIKNLQREKKFGKTLVSGKLYIYEADVTNNTVIYLHPSWKERFHLTETNTFDEVKHKVLEAIAPEHRQLLITNQSYDFIKNKFEHNESLILFTYKRETDNGNFEWHEAIVNIIRDDITKALCIRFYSTNIHKNKLKEQRALEEQYLYKSMLQQSSVAYEVNVTQDLAISGHEKWEQSFGIQKTNNYSEMILEFSKKAVHPKDRLKFEEFFKRDNVLYIYNNGERKMSFQYRKLVLKDEYKWVCCMFHLYEDPESGDIKGFSYVNNIDEQKKEELILKYNAEHDMMTDSYNKVVTEEKIEDYLSRTESKNNIQAFFMIDIDYFKQINDNFGHYFGDKILEMIAKRIKNTFRDKDIIGRLGGDEFCVFAKDLSSEYIIREKAQRLCEILSRDYFIDKKLCRISASIGVAIYPIHGSSYEELYKHADNCLYIAKRNGRNQYYL